MKAVVLSLLLSVATCASANSCNSFNFLVMQKGQSVPLLNGHLYQPSSYMQFSSKSMPIFILGVQAVHSYYGAWSGTFTFNNQTIPFSGGVGLKPGDKAFVAFFINFPGIRHGLGGGKFVFNSILGRNISGAHGRLTERRFNGGGSGNTIVTPEPNTLVLLGTGILMIAFLIRKKALHNVFDYRAVGSA